MSFLVSQVMQRIVPPCFPSLHQGVLDVKQALDIGMNPPKKKQQLKPQSFMGLVITSHILVSTNSFCNAYD